MVHTVMDTNLGKIRIVEIDGDYYFIVKEIAPIIGIHSPKSIIKNHIPEKETRIVGIYDGNQHRNMKVISEVGLDVLMEYSEFKEDYVRSIHDDINKILNGLEVGQEIIPQEPEERAKQHQRNEIIQLYDTLDERRQRLLLVYIRALSGKSALNQ